MNEISVTSLDEICRQLAGQRLPRWQELPDLELYMDQVLALIGRYLGSYPGIDNKGLTSSMVNNYVKLGVMPAPVKKKYTRTHLAHLIVICVLKPCLPIASIQQLIADGLSAATEKDFYDHFCELFEQTGQAVAQSAEQLSQEQAPSHGLRAAVYHSALRAQAEQALALRLLSLLFPATTPADKPDRAK